MGSSSLRKARNKAYEIQRGYCCFCFRKAWLPQFDEPGEPDLVATAEHFISKFHGGSDDPINIVMSCTRCNGMRGHMDAYEFAELAKNPNYFALRAHETVANKQRKAEKRAGVKVAYEASLEHRDNVRIMALQTMSMRFPILDRRQLLEEANQAFCVGASGCPINFESSLWAMMVTSISKVAIKLLDYLPGPTQWIKQKVYRAARQNASWRDYANLTTLSVNFASK